MEDFPEVAGLTLRSVETQDAPFLSQLYASTRADLQLLDADPAMIATLISMQQQLHERGQRSAFPDARQLLLTRADQAIGRMVIDTHPEHGMRVIDIALLPQSRGQGHGSAVLRAVQEQAALRQMPLRLRVARDNAGARRLYQSLGFVRDGGDEVTDEMVWHAGAAP